MNKPKTGLAGLKAHFASDITAGFLVFLLALPLSLGIAKASGFPAATGVLTAIIGGLLTIFFKVSELSIKGPAAGLITISAAAVAEFGGGTEGWQTVCALIVIMALLQILMGVLKMGSLSDFFPHSAVQGMLAAIGIIIIAKQIPVLLGDDPELYAGESPIDLLLDIPKFITKAHWHIAIIGLLGLAIMFIMPILKIKFLKKIPAPMVVLLMAIPLTIFWKFEETEATHSLVNIGDFWGSLDINANFSAISTFAFWKYVIMFLFISSLESLLTVKAIDSLDPYKRQSNYNGDLIGQGAGNTLSGLLGGLPMISEVVRSSSNIGYGAKTKWANFFHGFFLLLAMLIMIPVIELIPNSALAAMLVYAGYKLASPKKFVDTYKSGLDQLLIFTVTIVVTLAEDLLLGILAGILVKLIIHLVNGATFSNLFSAKFEFTFGKDSTTLNVNGAAIFSNLIAFKKVLAGSNPQKKLIINFKKATLVDHSFMSFIHNYQNKKIEQGAKCEIIGLENHYSFSKHPLATRKLTEDNQK